LKNTKQKVKLASLYLSLISYSLNIYLQIEALHLSHTPRLHLPKFQHYLSTIHSTTYVYILNVRNISQYLTYWFYA